MEITLAGESVNVGFWMPMVGWLAVLAIYIIVTVILYYHWSKYGLDSPGIKIARSSYFIITGLLLLGSLVALIVAYV